MTRQSGRRANSFVAPNEKLSESHSHSIDFRGERNQLRTLLGRIFLTIPLARRDNKRFSQYGSEATLLDTFLLSLTASRESVQISRVSKSLSLVFVYSVKLFLRCGVAGKAVRAILSSGSLGTFLRCVFERGHQTQTQVLNHQEDALSAGRAPLHLLCQR